MSTSIKPYSPVKTFLLTGAGFTKSFGEYLGSEMWAAILRQPEIQDDDALRSRLLDVPGLNFELFYDEVENLSHYTPDQKDRVRVALRQAYKEMDEILYSNNKSEAVAVGNFLKRFAGSINKRSRGFIFTLNQDLFAERFYVEDEGVSLPGVQTRPEWFKGSTQEWKYAIRLPTKNKIKEYKEEFWRKGQGPLMYVKLHGSTLWKSEDGSDAMVIGHGKKGRMEKEPLLDWFLEIFEKVLNWGSMNLVIIGYGFGDDHINALIGNAVKDSGLRLSIIGPTEPLIFKELVLRAPAPPDFSQNESLGDIIWKGLSRYYPTTVSHFYRTSTSTLPPQGDSFFRALGLL